MARQTPPDLTDESFTVWATQIGIQAGAAHMSTLHGEVHALLRRLAPVGDIDTSSVSMEDAVSTGEGSEA